MIARYFNIATASAALILASAALVILGPVPPAQAAAFCPDDWAAARALNQRNYATALRHLRPLADQGHPGSQHVLGMMYAKGHGVPRDPQEAIRWWRKAAGLGHDWAQIELQKLGLSWDRIDGAPEYYDRGKAARKIVADAQRLLTELGYRPGPVDGMMGPKTCNAILTFQTDNGLPTDGLATRTLLGATTRIGIEARRRRITDAEG